MAKYTVRLLSDTVEILSLRFEELKKEMESEYENITFEDYLSGRLTMLAQDIKLKKEMKVFQNEKSQD